MIFKILSKYNLSPTNQKKPQKYKMSIDSPSFEMSKERKSKQWPITLSPKAEADYIEVADFLEIPVATLLRQILESHHQSTEFEKLLKRVEQSEKSHTEE
jgi:hypothetical protein